MKNKKKLPIGISDFKKLIEGNYYFVDKSLFIEEIIEDSAEVILLPRPRRFGKTLNLSMLRYFFENKEVDDIKNLYSGLKIEKSNVFDKHFGKYPVIYFTFKDMKFSNFEDMKNGIKWLISNEFRSHRNIKTSLDKEDNKYFEIIEKNEGAFADYHQSLVFLSQKLYEFYNQKVVILIDEYDTPIQSSFYNGYYDELISFMRNLLSGAYKDNSYLFKGVITGILRISKESIFSGLNNIGVYTILRPEYSDRFGLTEREIKEMLSDFDLNEKYDEISNWYNGYIFGNKVIYNPWSLINYVASLDHEPRPYWANTSSNSIIKDLVKSSGLGFRKSIELLLRNEAIETELDENIVFPELKNKEIYIYSLLFFSGYLKYVERLGKADDGYSYRLSIPNKETYFIYKSIISSWIEESFENNRLKIMLKSLINLDIKIFEKIFSEFVRDTLSYFDVNKRNEEAVYQAFLLGLLINLNDYEIVSNKEAGYGRVDIMLLHKTDKNKPVIIMELKTIDEFEEETKENSLESALKQIKNKEYESQAKNRGYSDIHKFGVVFDGKRVWIKEGKN